MSDLAQRLESLGYMTLFLSLDDAQLNALWAEPGAEAMLTALVVDTSATSHARFLAAEVLFRKQAGYPPDAARAGLAPVYASALREADLGNIWGMPGELDGVAGQHLVTIGEPMVAALTPLLDDTREVPYGGSEEVFVAKQYRYRVKDFAAFFIGKIRDLPYTVHTSPHERDAEIERLRAAL